MMLLKRHKGIQNSAFKIQNFTLLCVMYFLKSRQVPKKCKMMFHKRHKGVTKDSKEFKI